jgi:hypothetical protein
MSRTPHSRVQRELIPQFVAYTCPGYAVLAIYPIWLEPFALAHVRFLP